MKYINNKLSQKKIKFNIIENKIEKLILSPFPIPDPIPTPKPSDKSLYPNDWILMSHDIFNRKIQVNKALEDNVYYNINVIYCDTHYNLDIYNEYDLIFLIKTYANNLVVEMNDIERLKHQLLFISRLSVNYHSKAEKFYLNISNIATYLAIILSAGSIVALVSIQLTHCHA